MSTLYRILFILLLILQMAPTMAQGTDANIFGDVQSKNEHLPFVTIYIEGTNLGTTTDETGHYMLIDLPEGEHVLVAKMMGYLTQRDTVFLVPGKTLEVNFNLEEETMVLNEFVVTGTRTFKRNTESAVIVNVMENKSLNAVQACNISEGLRFQPGLRVETDCQTCNYTQLRMNGLGGGYSQILINGRPIFSPLMGLYGMEQLPTNMIDRVEVVRGGGSALYGSGAIGGTVNIITRIPTQDNYDLQFATHSINGGAVDNILAGNANVLTQKRNAGISLFVNHRNREAYDHNGDKFSELPLIRNNSFGTNMFFKPNENQKIELNFSSLSEYRFGGEMVKPPAYLTQQSEERQHNILMGGLDYQLNFNDDNSSVIAYFAGQNTDRDHYTGIFPDDPEDIQQHLNEPPYGTTENSTFQAGAQVNHRFLKFPGGPNVISLGLEYIYDDVFDTIPAYRYVVDQTTRNTAGYLQSDWEIFPDFNLLAGLRMDQHNLVDHLIFSPRISALYKLKNTTQFRLTWGTGFRAPQAFDADMHIAFAGGGVSRIQLAPELHEERSNSISGSVNFDKAKELFIVGFTVEGFYTKLNDAFFLQPVGEDEFGELFEKRNGPGATVQGATFEFRANYNRQTQIEAGFTLQTSVYDEPVETIEGLEPIQEFLRTPDEYGFATLLFTPNEHWNGSVSVIYTGPMKLVHFAGAPEQQEDAYKVSKSFTELNFKLGYTWMFRGIDSGLELFGGVKNILNAFQDDFDTGKYRDSNYIYGPGAPRTFFIGLRIRSI
jgi:outer membrane receptor for ferrienterochelin and colicins